MKKHHFFKPETRFGKIVWRVFAISSSIVVLIGAIVLVRWAIGEIGYNRRVKQYERMVNSPTYLHDYYNNYVSPCVIFHDDFPGYLYNTTLGRRTETGIEWICKSSDGDSLACYNKDDKRGYFNRFTGEVAIPPQYEKAWIFSEGLACVMEKGMLHFIDHKGRKAIDKEFPYSNCLYDYCFHNGLCVMLGDGNRVGLIDQQGNWVVEPQYYDMDYSTKGFWRTIDRDYHYGLMDAQGQVLLPTEFDYIEIDERDSCIFVRHLNHLEQVLDFECNVINPCYFTEVIQVTYLTEVFDEEGEQKVAVANCFIYRNRDWYYGLMDKNGKVLTPPRYTSIYAIGPDRYRCYGPNGSVILDDKGREIVQNID